VEKLRETGRLLDAAAEDGRGKGLFFTGNRAFWRVGGECYDARGMAMERATVESLERRLALHAAHAVLLPDGTVEIEGDGQKDVIGIERESSRLIVSFRYYAPQSFDYKTVRRITVLALGGDDVITVGNAVRRTVIMDGGDGDDFIQGGGGRDKIRGGAGADTLVGEDGNDVLRGEDDGDVLRGGEGNDRLLGGDGNDVLRGDAGRDVMRGEAGKDSLIAEDGEPDVLDGGDGKDRGRWDKKDARKRLP
jgi:Ca2+-binding RTX toxin-like protein